MNSSIRNHPSFKYLIQRCFPSHFGTYSFIRKVYLGNFFNKHKWNIRLEIEESGYDNEDNDHMIFVFHCIREGNLYNVDSNVLYELSWKVPQDYEYIMKNVDKEIKKLMKLMDDIHECQHCGKYIFTESSFEEKCFLCGMQSLYDDVNSDKSCSICLQPVGYGYIKKCKNKHFMHSYCFIKYNLETNKDLCPLRCGSIIE